jgi:hypothetical protein
MLAWDEANLPRDIEGLMRLNPKWSRLDAAWKLVTLEQICFSDATAAFAGNAPWDLRDDAAKVAALQPTVWVMPRESRFVPCGIRNGCVPMSATTASSSSRASGTASIATRWIFSWKSSNGSAPR